MGSEQFGQATKFRGVSFLCVLRLSLRVRETRFFGTGILHPFTIYSEFYLQMEYPIVKGIETLYEFGK
jgi:hypothetical protein